MSPDNDENFWYNELFDDIEAELPLVLFETEYNLGPFCHASSKYSSIASKISGFPRKCIRVKCRKFFKENLFFICLY